MGKLRLISLIVLLLTAPQVLGLDVEIVPESPTSSDVVTITLSGWWGGCAPNVSNISVEGNNIYFDALLDYPPDTICIGGPWELSEDVGPLSAGTYSVYGSCCGIIPGGDYEWLTDLTVVSTRDVPSQYPTIQAAIDDCNDGDTVVVAPGTYFGPGNRDIDFLGKAITVRSENPEDPCVVAATVVNCYGSSVQPHRGFIFNSGEGHDSVLDGLTITNGYAVVTCGGGGGIYINGASPTISRCIITDNYVELEEGSLCFCQGGGIYIEDGNDAIITNCIISENSLGDWGWGAGIYCIFSESVTINNCLINDNTALGYSSRGGGIYCSQSTSIAVSGCTIADNSAFENGGGIRFETYESPTRTVDNSIVWGNSPDQIYNPNSTNVLVSYSDIQGGWAGTGNIDADPCFVDADANDFHLQEDSPCFNAGDPNYVAGPGETDIDGQRRVMDMRIDMGADETGKCMARTNPDYDTWVSLGEPNCWCYQYQCRGDADGEKQLIFQVYSNDLALIKSCYAKPGPPPGCICADFDHDSQLIFRVYSGDLGILKSYYAKPNIPLCGNPPDPNYNYWEYPE